MIYYLPTELFPEIFLEMGMDLNSICLSCKFLRRMVTNYVYSRKCERAIAKYMLFGKLGDSYWSAIFGIKVTAHELFDRVVSGKILEHIDKNRDLLKWILKNNVNMYVSKPIKVSAHDLIKIFGTPVRHSLPQLEIICDADTIKSYPLLVNCEYAKKYISSLMDIDLDLAEFVYSYIEKRNLEGMSNRWLL